jgi:hypothetical protein
MGLLDWVYGRGSRLQEVVNTGRHVTHRSEATWPVRARAWRLASQGYLYGLFSSAGSRTGPGPGHLQLRVALDRSSPMPHPARCHATREHGARACAARPQEVIEASLSPTHPAVATCMSNVLSILKRLAAGGGLGAAAAGEDLAALSAVYRER